MQSGATDATVHAAHADAWQAEGRARAAHGGGARSWPGVRAMASGIATPKWNNADLAHADVDLAPVAAWYARLGMPWGIRAPLASGVTAGEHLFVKRCMATRLPVGASQAPQESAHRGLVAANYDEFIDLERRVFGDPADDVRAWLTPRFTAGPVSPFGHWVLRDDRDAPLAIASTVATDDVTGPALMISGIGLLPDIRGDSPAIAVLTRLVGAIATHAPLMWRSCNPVPHAHQPPPPPTPAPPPAPAPDLLLHAYPDDDVEAAALRACEFVETAGLEVRLMPVA